MSTLSRKQRARAAAKVDEIIKASEDPASPKLSKSAIANLTGEWLREQKQKDCLDSLVDTMALSLVEGRLHARRASLQGKLDLDTYSNMSNALIPLGGDEFVRFGAAGLEENRTLVLHSERNMRAVEDAHWLLCDNVRPIMAEQEKDRTLTTDDVMKRRGWVPPMEPPPEPDDLDETGEGDDDDT